MTHINSIVLSSFFTCNVFLELLNVHLKKLIVYYGRQGLCCVNGSQRVWNIYNAENHYCVTLTSALDCGFHDKPALQTIEFDYGEFIEFPFRINSGMLVDKIEINTNFGKHYEYGGNGGSFATINVDSKHNFQLKNKHIVIGFHGGYGGHLHNVGTISCPVQQHVIYQQILLSICDCTKKVFSDDIIDTIMLYII